MKILLENKILRNEVVVLLKVTSNEIFSETKVYWFTNLKGLEVVVLCEMFHSWKTG